MRSPETLRLEPDGLFWRRPSSPWPVNTSGHLRWFVFWWPAPGWSLFLCQWTSERRSWSPSAGSWTFCCGTVRVLRSKYNKKRDEKTGRDPRFSPSEEEGQERPGQIQPLVAVMISVVQLSSAQSRQQEPVHHITDQKRFFFH